MKKTTREQTSGSSPIKVGIVPALDSFAKTYPTTEDMILELLQNGIDAKANLIRINVNLQKRRVTVADNGTGATVDMFEEALLSVGRSIKNSPEQFGRFGRGFVSPFGKCVRFHFESVHMDENPGSFRRWTFESERWLDEDTEINSIPWKLCKEFYYTESPNLKLSRQYRSYNKVDWRTRVVVEGLHTDERRLGVLNIESLRKEASRRFRATIKERGIDVRLSVTGKNGRAVCREKEAIVAVSTEGTEPLGVVKMSDVDAGEVIIDLALARIERDGSRRGDIDFFGLAGRSRPQPLSSQQLRLMVQRGHGQAIPMDEDALRALHSGIFTGEVRAEWQVPTF